jgi:hypothetical protein
MNTVKITFVRQEIPDEWPDVSHLKDTADNYEGCTPDEIAKYVEQDSARLQAYYDGEWQMIGIRCIARIEVTRNGCTTRYELESAGLWGIESDSGQSYFDEVFEDQKSELVADLVAMGINGGQS